jgi:hypothetical protein
MPDFEINDLVLAAERLQSRWDQTGRKFCFIGGLAVQRWGEPRLTNDIDATVWTEYGNEQPVIDELLKELFPRIEDASGFAKLYRVLLVQESQGVDVDISLAAFPFELDVIQRSSLQKFSNGVLLRVCDPSDLVILKSFANRPRDWQDIRGVLIRSGRLLDWPRIEQELLMLAELKEEPEIVDQLSKLRHSLNQVP